MQKVKYPSTPHMPESPGVSRLDKVLKSLAHFEGREVVLPEKMDGETANLYRVGFHARSLDSASHPSQTWIKTFHASFAHRIPEGWRICGENLFAKHSIAYTSLPSYFMVFSVWNQNNVALSWDDTVAFCDAMGLLTVPVLERGMFSMTLIKRALAKLDTTVQEGLVMRLADAFAFEDFERSLAKWVRFGHVQTDDHWKHKSIVPNGLIKRLDVPS